MFCLYLNLFFICNVYISSSPAFSIVRFSFLLAENLLSDSFPFITASPLDLHDFNPPPFLDVIQSVKQQPFVQSAVKATVVNSFQLFFFCNPIWCPNDHPHFHTEYWRGALHPCHEPNFQVQPCCDEFPCCESETDSRWVSKLILYFNALNHKCRITVFCCSGWLHLISNHVLMFWKPQEGWKLCFWLWLVNYFGLNLK